MSNLSSGLMRSLPLVVAAISILAAGCAVEVPSAPPPIRGPLPLSEVDQDVVIALTEQVLIPRQEAAPGDAPPLALLSDITRQECENGNRKMSGIECFISAGAASLLERSPDFDAFPIELFPKQNAKRRRITLPRLERMRLISLIDTPAFDPHRRFNYWPLLQVYPEGSKVFTISAPVYASENEASLYYHSPDSHGGFASLVREQGRWIVTKRMEWIE